MNNNIKTLLKIGLSLIALNSLVFLSMANPAGAQAAPKTILLDVPFTSQAPLGQWSDLRQEDGCEEAVTAMAMAWVKGTSGWTKTQWRNRIVGLSDWESKHFGEYRDTILKDTVAWIFKSYYNYDKVSIKPVNSTSDIVKELAAGHVVLTPMNGQALHNPYYVQPGPITHMMLIKGYDYNTREFIVNDAGTKRGESYRYPADILFKAIRVYDTGSHIIPKTVTKAMIVVEKN